MFFCSFGIPFYKKSAFFDQRAAYSKISRALTVFLCSFKVKASELFEKIIDKMYSPDYKKEKSGTKNLFLSSEERERILSAQKESLEWID